MRIELLLTAAAFTSLLFASPNPCRQSHFNQLSASSTLKTIVSAQEDFRENDRDGDGIHLYWIRDICGLYCLPGSDGPIRLIELSAAAADAAPLSSIEHFAARSPKAGFWYKALRPAGGDVSGRRFAACGYPASPQAGRFVFVLDERKICYRAPFEKIGIPNDFPSDEDLRLRWSKVE